MKLELPELSLVSGDDVVSDTLAEVQKPLMQVAPPAQAPLMQETEALPPPVTVAPQADRASEKNAKGIVMNVCNGYPRKNAEPQIGNQHWSPVARCAQMPLASNTAEPW